MPSEVTLLIPTVVRGEIRKQSMPENTGAARSLPEAHRPDLNAFPRSQALCALHSERFVRAPPPRQSLVRVQPFEHHHLIRIHTTHTIPPMHLLPCPMRHDRISRASPRPPKLRHSDLVVRVRHRSSVGNGEGIAASPHRARRLSGCARR